MGTKEDNVSIDCLKAAHVDDTLPVPVAQPPRRGHPPTVPAAQREVPELPGPLLVHTMPTTNPLPVPMMPPTTQLSVLVPQVPKPTFAEVNTHAGRTTKLPHRFRD